MAFSLFLYIINADNYMRIVYLLALHFVSEGCNKIVIGITYDFPFINNFLKVLKTKFVFSG